MIITADNVDSPAVDNQENVEPDNMKEVSNCWTNFTLP